MATKPTGYTFPAFGFNKNDYTFAKVTLQEAENF